MKSDICKLTGQEGQLKAIFTEIEKCSVYNCLNARQALRLRLLAEELVEMLPELLAFAEGSFWIESEAGKYELHVSVKGRKIGLELRDKLLAVSTTGRNAAAVGIMGKIRAAAETMLLATEDSAAVVDIGNYGMESTDVYSLAWSMQSYARSVRSTERGASNETEWDELEKSIIANLADDVIVGVRGNRVDIVVRKTFNE